MLGTLGKPEEAIARRRSRVQNIAKIDTQLANMGERMDESSDKQVGGAQARPAPSETSLNVQLENSII